ncbi:hypothetical protein D0B54_12270 [Solimonas sp. K1W22B-7]|uniref:hypothetical protein n=1 Tax=Solimonas sp. K1W22B-7 TaxID=2303331 RepID=UPI000E333DA9|nr:hypothetical protein [Solimonas sp. K1W22B-7]AXQ29414.1 hypothetical protein D0B54_12270 [Solimonas sp. K1W22B-7]
MVNAARRPSTPGAPAAPRADVRILNVAKRRVAVVTDWGYTVAETNEGELRLRDVVEGPFEATGRCTWNNLSTGLPVSVTVTHVQATMIGAERLVQR